MFSGSPSRRKKSRFRFTLVVNLVKSLKDYINYKTMKYHYLLQ